MVSVTHNQISPTDWLKKQKRKEILDMGPCLQEAYVLVREARTNPVNQKIKFQVCKVSIMRLGRELRTEIEEQCFI